MFLAKKWGILIKKESESLIFTGLEIPRDYQFIKEDSYLKKKKDEITIRSSAAEYLTYVASVGDQQDSIEMRYEDENIWLTQKMMATLYDVGLPTINEHIKKIYADSELEEATTHSEFPNRFKPKVHARSLVIRSIIIFK